ncbi:unnamed protein product [Eretmochelys imbricata]
MLSNSCAWELCHWAPDPLAPSNSHLNRSVNTLSCELRGPASPVRERGGLAPRARGRSRVGGDLQHDRLCSLISNPGTGSLQGPSGRLFAPGPQASLRITSLVVWLGAAPAG